MHLNDTFPNGKSYKSYATAKHKVDTFNASVEKSYTGAMLDNVLASYHTVIVVTADNRYQPIAIMKRDCNIPVLDFIGAGLCVTN